MYSATLDLSPPGFVKDDEMGRLCTRLSEGLHALAQPLTILRSAVAASAKPGISADDQRRYMELTSRHVERACSLFECIQDLVIASQVKAECEPIELLELIAPAIADEKATLEAAGIELRVDTPISLPSVPGDAARTLQAFSASLKVAVSISSPGDLIELLIAAQNGFIELTLQNSRNIGRPLNSSQRLSLTLAEANVRSQQGDYECLEDPFHVSIALPLQAGVPYRRADHAQDELMTEALHYKLARTQ